MQRIINFIVNNRNAFLYAVLVLFGLIITVKSHSYHQSKFFNSSKWITGSIYGVSYDIKDYFNLKEENQRLVQENEQLREQLLNAPTTYLSDSLYNFTVTPAKALKNMYASPRNYITLDKGENDGIKQDMGVITPLGVLGIVENTSSNFSVVQSILNTKSNINAKIKNTNYFGSLVWNGKDYKIVQLIDIPRSVPLTVGDTITTGAMSSIFPEDIPIGVIKEYSLNENQSTFTISVDLFNDMANIKNVYIIKNKNRKEVLELQKLVEDAK